MNIRRPTDLRRKRDKQDTRKKYIIAGAGVVFLLVLAGSVVAIKRSEVFTVRAVEVVGVPVAYGEQVKRDMEAFSRADSFVFRFLGAENVLAWKSNQKAFLAANPQFRVLRVQKDYARRSLTITIDGREKFGVWCGAGKEEAVLLVEEEADATTTEDASVAQPASVCYWFDREGVLFAKAPQVQSELFNRVYDSTSRTLGLRDKIVSDRLFINLAKVFKLLEIADINTKTVFIEDLALEEAYADSVSDPRIIFSLRSDPSFALSAIDALKRSGEWSKLQYANFTVENRVSYR